MSAALKFAPHYTVRDYALWKGDWELWEGIAVAISPSPFGRHQTALTRLSRLLGNALDAAQCDAEAVVELDWIVADDTVVRPDVMVVCGDPPERHVHETPGLVAEVLSDSTRKNDLSYKRQLYHKSGVGCYLIVDPDAETIELDQRRDDGSYESTVAENEIHISLCDDCSVRIALSTVFRR